MTKETIYLTLLSATTDKDLLDRSQYVQEEHARQVMNLTELHYKMWTNNNNHQPDLNTILND